MKNKKKHTPEEAIRLVAMREGISEDTVRYEIERAIRLGFLNRDPEVRAFWNSVPCEGELPTPEEAIAFLVEDIDKNYKP